MLYQLLITLQEIEPPIWRRLLVPQPTTLTMLHRVLQVVMPWQDYHLHCFRINGETYGTRDPELNFRDERRMTLARLDLSPGLRFCYEYDFGDSWEHEILVEQTLPPRADVTYPLCIGGARACPPEDVGGVPGYEHFLEVLHAPDDADDEEREELLAWAGGDFDPEGFDRNRVNADLRRLPASFAR